MLDAGSPLGVVYFVKKVRDSLGASPQYRYSDNTPEKRFARQKEYIDTVRQIQAVMEDVQTVADAMGVYDRFLVGNGYVDMVQGWGSGIHYSATEKAGIIRSLPISWHVPFISAPKHTLNGISHRKPERNSLAFPKTRKYRRAMRSISMMEKTAIPEPVTGDRVLIMLQKAIQFCRQI